MNKLLNILNNDYLIDKIIINNFTRTDSDLSIEIYLQINELEIVNILFEEVKNININSDYYGVSETSSIMIDDVTNLQWEGMFYRVMISEDVMCFYCKNIEIKEEY